MLMTFTIQLRVPSTTSVRIKATKTPLWLSPLFSSILSFWLCWLFGHSNRSHGGSLWPLCLQVSLKVWPVFIEWEFQKGQSGISRDSWAFLFNMASQRPHTVFCTLDCSSVVCGRCADGKPGNCLASLSSQLCLLPIQFWCSEAATGSMRLQHFSLATSCGVSLSTGATWLMWRYLDFCFRRDSHFSKNNVASANPV